MPWFKVRWVDAAGEVHERREEGVDADALSARARARGERVLDIRSSAWRWGALQRRLGRFLRRLAPHRLTDRQVHQVFYELGVTLSAGVPLLPAVRLLRREPAGPGAAVLLERVESGIRRGESLSALLESSGSYDFRPLVPILRMGERTGRLGASCRSIAANLDEWIRVRSDITAALIYPLVLTGTGLLAVYLLLVMVIPRFQEAFAGLRVTLPAHARWLFALSAFLNAHHDGILAGLMLLCLLLLFLLRLPSGRERLRRMALRLPLVRRIRFAAENVRFVTALSHLLAGGVPILASLELAADSFSLPPVRRRLEEAAAALKRGRSLADALEDSNDFPLLMVNMIRVGEESGTLEGVTAELRDMLARRFSRRVRTAMALLEPLVILLIAAFVALLVLSILPVILNLGEFNG